ncbi:FkbM family methyltransferase [Streptomyces aureoverticillatus]|uniref:FkbM family methyltransferase n=1 Tax=Streptomyces aureoverticillatus TaxID=66871 RepID=UPI0013DC189B|nr:FkbM family methyltransferase [Streptomyces aureoverticillatus]QIB44494.1 FkbM family methyltransferase [Streptomyces aureoverticillatus]
MAEVVATLARAYVRRAPGFACGKGALVSRYLNPRLREHPRRRVVDSVFGARFAVDTRDLIQRYIYMYGAWEPHMMSWLATRLGAGDVLVDVGANVGFLSVYGSRLVGETGRVVSIEASPVFHRRVLQHAELNGCDNIRAVNAAVSDSDKTLTFVLASSRNMGANSIVPWDGPAESTFEMEARPLPSLLRPDEIARARVIKIDVEGAEGGVVRGLAPMLGELRPDAEITVEVTPERMEQLGDSVEELLETMREHGFHTYRLANDYAPESYPSALRSPEPPVRWRGPVTSESDLIFSRVDAETLK